MVAAPIAGVNSSCERTSISRARGSGGAGGTPFTPYANSNSPTPIPRPRPIISHATFVDGRRWMIRAPITGNSVTIPKKPTARRSKGRVKRGSPNVARAATARATAIAAIASRAARRWRRRVLGSMMADVGSTAATAAVIGASRGSAEVALDRDDVLELLDPAQDARELADGGNLQGGPDDRAVIWTDGDVRGEDVDLRLGDDLGDVAQQPGAVIGLDAHRDRVGLLRRRFPLDIDEA